MGLDITVYQLATPLGGHSSVTGWCRQQDEWGETHKQAFVYKGFERSAAGLELFDAYTSGCHLGRCYHLSGESMYFRAGSYGGYNTWRNQLCLDAIGVEAEQVWANKDKYADAPFFLLVNFADNEGWIGPAAAQRLAREFDEHIAKVGGTLDKWALDLLETWQKACHLAAGTGVLIFR